MDIIMLNIRHNFDNCDAFIYLMSISLLQASVKMFTFPISLPLFYEYNSAKFCVVSYI